MSEEERAAVWNALDRGEPTTDARTVRLHAHLAEAFPEARVPELSRKVLARIRRPAPAPRRLLWPALGAVTLASALEQFSAAWIGFGDWLAAFARMPGLTELGMRAPAVGYAPLALPWAGEALGAAAAVSIFAAAMARRRKK